MSILGISKYVTIKFVCGDLRFDIVSILTVIMSHLGSSSRPHPVTREGPTLPCHSQQRSL